MAEKISTSQWFKNAGKSMGTLSKNLMSDIMPSTVSTLGSTRDAMRDARQFASQFTQISRTQTSQMNRSVSGKRAKAIFDSAMNDLKNGTFGIDKASDDLFDSWDDEIAEDFDMNSWESDAEVSSDEIVMTSSQGVAKSVMRAGAAQLEGMQAMTKAIVGSNLRSNQAASAQTVNAIMYMGDAINKNLLGISTTLQTINKNLVGLIEFQNENVSPTNQAIVNYLEESSIMMKDMGKLLENWQEARDGKYRDSSGGFSVKNGFDFREYADFVKKNFNNNSYVQLFKLGRDMGMFDKPVNMMIQGLMGAIVPNAIKSALGEVDKNLHDYIQEGLHRLSDIPIIGEIFGVKRQGINRMNLGNFNKEAMPWNGVAQRYLTEVIPELLTSIEAKMPTKRDYDPGSKRYYDIDSGTFRKRRDLLRDDKDDVESLLGIAFMDPMTKLMDQIKVNGASTQEQAKAIENLTKIVNARITGATDVTTSQSQMKTTLDSMNITGTQFKDAFLGMERAFKEFTESMNDRSYQIGTGSSVMRNVYNKHGQNEWTRYGTLNPMAFVFNDTGDFDPKGEIENILYSNDRGEVSINRDMVKAYIDARRQGATEGELRRLVLDLADQRDARSFGQDLLKKLRRKFAMGGNRGQKAADGIRAVDDQIFAMMYGMNGREFRSRAVSGGTADDGSDDDGSDHLDSRESSSTVGAASSFLTQRRGIKAGAGTGRNRRGIEISALGARGTVRFKEGADRLKRYTARFLQTDPERVINRTAEERSANDEIIMNELSDQMNEAPDETLEGSIAQMNNTTRTGILAILNSFQNMSSGIFGKDGFISKFFTSEGFKNTMGDLKEKLIGEEGVFSKQWKNFKAGAKDVWGKAKGHLSDGYDWVYRNTMTYLAGEDYEKSDLYRNYLSRIDIKNKNRAKGSDTSASAQVDNASDAIEFALSPTEGHENNQALDEIFDAANRLADQITESGEVVIETALGDPNETPEQKKKSFLSKFKSMLPKGVAGAIAGAGLVALSGGSMGLLGSLFLPHSIIGGAIVGFGTTILSQTEAFKSILFGKENDDGERQGGLITKEMGKAFKKAAPLAVGGAVMGLLRNVITGGNGIFSKGPLGVLTGALLPGGPLGGAILGMSIGLLKNSDTIKDKLFGEKGEDGKRTNGMLSGAYNKFTSGLKKALPTIGRGAAGAGIGALTGLTLSHMGFIPAMFSMGGPVGGAMAGLALGIASSSKKFNEWIFGSEELDENGNPTGKRNKDGLLGRMRNMLNVHVFEPIAGTFKKTFLNVRDWLKEAIEYPFRLAFGPVIESLRNIKDNIVDTISNILSTMSKGIVDIFHNVFGKLFGPVTKVMQTFAKGIGKGIETGMKAAALPITAPLKILEFATMGKRRGEYIDFYKNYFGNLGGTLKSKWANEETTGFGKVKDVFGAIFDPDNEIKAAAREGYNEMMSVNGKNVLNWRNVGAERRQLHQDKRDRRKDEKRWTKIDKLRRDLSSEWGGREFELRDAELESLQKKLGKLGIDKDMIATSDDIMDLVYRRSDWKKKNFGPKDEGIVIAKTSEDKAHEEKIDKGVDYLEEIRDIFRDIAFNQVHSDWDATTRKKQNAAMKKIRNYAKKHGIDVDQFYQFEDADLVDASELTDEEWDEYRNSKYFQAGDYHSWIKDHKAGIDTSIVAEEAPKNDPTDGMRPWEKAMYKLMNRTAEATEASNVIATGGASPDEIIENANASGGIRRKFFDKFNVTQTEAFQNIKNGFGNVMDNIFRRKSKKDAKDARDAREAEEQARATGMGDETDGGGDGNETGIVTNIFQGEQKEKKKGIFSTLLGFLGNAGSFIGNIFGGGMSNGIGGIVGSIFKGWGIASLIIGLIDAFNPGFSASLKQDAENLSQNVSKIIDTHIAPFVGKVFETIGTGINTAIDFALDTGSLVYQNILKPIGEGFVKLVTQYGPSVIRKGADVMVQLIPSMVDAFITVVPALAKALTKGIYDATVGKFFGNQSDTREVTEGDVAFAGMTPDGDYFEMTADGKYISVNPKTGNRETTGSNTGIGPNGERYTVANKGGTNAVVRLLGNSALSMMAKGSSSIAGKIIRAGATGIGGAAGAVGGTALKLLHIPGLGTITGAKLGAKTGGGLAKGFTGFFEKIGNKGAKAAAEAVTEEAAEKATEIVFTNAAETAGKTAVENAMEAVGKTMAGNATEAVGKTIVGNSIETGVKSGAEAAGKAAAEAAAETVSEKMVEGVADLATNKTFAAAVQKFASKFPGVGKLISKFGTWLKKVTSTVTSKLKSMGEKATKYLDNAAEKLGIGAAKAFPIITVAFMAIDGVTGWCEANNLFHTSTPDTCMKVVSALMKVLLGLGIVGPVIDIIIEIGSAITGIDYKCEMASTIYGILMGEERANKLKADQEAQKLEAEIYNSIMNTNLSEDAYNDLKNKTVLDKIGDGFFGLFSADRRARNEAEKKAIEQAQAIAKQEGAITTISFSSSSTTQRGGGRISVTGNSSVADGYFSAGTSYGYGLGYGRNYSQGDSRWGKMRIGTLPNGAAATMANAGCGPTALAMAANDLGKGRITPASVGALAARSGYISAGGANAGLFTAGAARMGLTSSPIRNQVDMAAKIASGKPVILSGKSAGSNDPYTNAGHIVVAEGMDSTGRVKVKDPIDGISKRYHFGDLARSTKVGFALGRGKSLGYGISRNAIARALGYGYQALDPTADAMSITNISGNMYPFSISDYDIMMKGNIEEYESAIAADAEAAKPITGSAGKSATANADYKAALEHLARFSTSAYRKFDSLNVQKILGFAVMALQNGGQFHDPRMIDGKLVHDKISRTSVNKSDLLAALQKISNGEAPNGGTAPTKAEQNDATSLRFALAFNYQRTGSTPSGDSRTFVYSLMFDDAPGTMHLKKLWDRNWLPVNDTYIYYWAQALLENQFGTSTKNFATPCKFGLPISAFIAKLKLIAYGIKTNKTRQALYLDWANKLETKFERRLKIEQSGKTTAQYTAEEKKAQEKANMATLYADIVSDLTTRKISDYNTSNINGYTWYDIGDENWSKLKYYGKELAQTSPKVSSELMAMSSLLSTFTGKPFTPKFMIEKLLPYVAYQNKTGNAMPYRTNSQTGNLLSEGYMFEPTHSTNLKNFFDLDFITDAGGNKIVPKGWTYTGGKVDQLKSDLANNIPFFFKSSMFDGSIFGGSGSVDDRDKPENAVAGILQRYQTSDGLLQYLASNMGMPLYTNGSNIFERFSKEHLVDGGIQFTLSDGTVPRVVSSSGQYGILADGLTEPEVEDDDTGPFAILKRLLRAIYKGAEGLLGTFLNGGSAGEVLGDTANRIANALSGRDTNRTTVYGASAASLGVPSGGSTSENEAAVWKFFKSKGLSDIATAALMGNFMAESGFNPANLQNSYNTSIGMNDADYTAAVDSGRITRQQFAGKGHTHGGYGLAQWTYYTRKQGLYDMAKARGTSIGDLATQLDWAWSELQNQGHVGKLNNFQTVGDATAYVLDNYEMAASRNPSQRTANANQILAKYGGVGMGLGYGPDHSGFINDANVVAKTMGGLMYSKLYGGSWRDGMNQIGDMSAGITLDRFGNGGGGSGAFGQSVGADFAQVTPPKSLASAKPKQQELVQQMMSKLGKLRYSLSGGKQNPDNGWGSCASTVNWAYRKVFGNLGLTSMETNGASSLSRRADGNGANDLWTPVWKKTSANARISTDIMEPGDIVFYNWDRAGAAYNPNIQYPMQHVEMYAGDGKDLNHGGPNEGDIGTTWAPINDYRKARMMMVSRFNQFVDRGSLGNGLGYGDGMEEAAWNALKINQGQIRDQIDSGLKAASRRTPVYHETSEGYGYGPGATANEVAKALRNDKSGKVIEAILGVITEWHNESKQNSGGGNVTVNNTTNNVVTTNGQTATEEKKEPIKPQKMDNSRLQQLHRQISHIKRK